ncbi:MAG: hypothetical protein WC861_04390 [Candidatus Micrarchaeia archaeon]
MRGNIALIALVSLALLFGCTGSSVPQEKYDELAASCSKAKADDASLLASEIAKTSAANAKVSSCTAEKQSLESLLAVREQENGALRAEEAVLAKARAKMDLAVQYNATIGYYMEAFGPGRLPNTARLKKIDTQVDSLNDSALRPLWLGVKGCQGITGCDTAKAKFLAYIDGRMAALRLEAAAIVGTTPG